MRDWELNLEMNSNKIINLALIFVFSFIILSIFFVVRTNTLRANAHKRFDQIILSQNVEVISGTVDGPAVKIQIKSSTEFISKIAELNASVVYKSYSSLVYTYYYVFTPDYQITYFFRLEIDLVTGEMVN